jgi:hypothetical protein
MMKFGGASAKTRCPMARKRKERTLIGFMVRDLVNSLWVIRFKG